MQKDEEKRCCCKERHKECIMKTLSVKEQDDINDVKNYMMFLGSILQGWYFGAEELNLEQLKEAFCELHFQLYDKIKKLDQIGKRDEL